MKETIIPPEPISNENFDEFLSDHPEISGQQESTPSKDSVKPPFGLELAIDIDIAVSESTPSGSRTGTNPPGQQGGDFMVDDA